MYWQKEIETMDRQQLRKMQLDCINKQLALAKNAPYYKDKLANISELKSLEEVTKLPFTTKQDLRDAFPYGLLSTDLKNVVRLHSSSGTTGN
ncbi:MAG: phenylacetate--CoA ligase, partial [Elusimicrobia bacterium]|nr:phenylacetate--CoA ligase [Elusimicrobiota bacterium]